MRCVPLFQVSMSLDDPSILRVISHPPRDIPLSVRLDLRFCPPNLMSAGRGWFLSVMGFAFALIVSSVTELDDLVPRNWGDIAGEVGLPHVFWGCCLFGVIGLYSPIKGLFVGGKAVWLLQYGHAVIARYSGMEPTGMSIHRRGSERDTLIMNVNFEYQVSGNNYAASVQALETDTFRWTETKTKIVFYDPMRPDKSVVLDGVPGGIQIDELTGRFQTNPLNYALQLLAATIVLVQIVAIVVLVIRAI